MSAPRDGAPDERAEPSREAPDVGKGGDGTGSGQAIGGR
ncbi:hypothetical protein ABIB37_002199 [Agrococcus sp. UYP10]|uniref:Uncharacterized protein n=1 Tax=Agrococcus jenensis TaxID=46353 RepID=A0A3N2AW77_9MICO|nr:hypothetical protein EDD26_2594 [Agrococcus jenensis]